jgi:hypothetical protein
MNIKQVFELGVKMGITADPRGEVKVKKYLERTKKEYEEMKDKDKEYFDEDSLVNPYADSKIHFADQNKEVKRVLAGIDIGSAEILLASQLSERGKEIDVVIAHHPIGQSLADLHGVMDMAVEIYEANGVPVHTAEKLMEERIKEVGRGVHPANHYRVVDMARLLNVNFINTHTITDNLVNNFLTDFLAEKKPELIKDLVDALLEIPEYKQAKKQSAGPKLFSGGPNHRVGKILLEMTGGTSPSEKVYQAFSQAGISTIVGMHLNEVSNKKASANNMNVVIAGHIASDSLGMNLFLDELEKQGIEVITCGGLMRIKR